MTTPQWRQRSPIDQQAALKAISASYNLKGTLSLQGNSFSCDWFKLVTLDENYFVKVFGAWRIALKCASCLDECLNISAKLAETGQMSDIVVPLKTNDGNLTVTGEFGTLVVFPFVEAKTLADVKGWDCTADLDLMRTLARLFAQLHTATIPRKAQPNCNSMVHDVSFIDEWDCCLSTMQQQQNWSRSTQQELVSLMTSDDVVSLVQSAIERLLKLQTHLLDTCPPSEWCLCHTDLHAANVLYCKKQKHNDTLHNHHHDPGTDNNDERVQLLLIDWDDVCWAPAECDLRCFTESNTGFTQFLDMYKELGGKVDTLDTNRFEFYIIRRLVVDLIDWLVRIIWENSSSDTDAEDIKEVRDWSIMGLRSVEKDAQRIHQQLTNYNQKCARV
eukprot:TRINITY_DN51687_c0_g1_i1.p1 TRINITY_DN51687_c0_g1~~TRINITY_DN51687_c0_g1_i1.p1  ORF type:complete len:388 (+),score=30.60 TRINITY_DN51687_c0_g1_i1:19-1182(+)